MADYRIKSNLDLDISQAQSKLNDFKNKANNEKISMKADLDSSSTKKAVQDRGKISRKVTQELLNNELKDYKKYLDKQAQLEHKYLNAKKDKTRKEIEKQLKDNEKIIATEQKRLQGYGDKSINSAIKDLDKAFLNRGSSIQYLKSLKDIEVGARKSLKRIENFETDHAQKSANTYKERYRNILEGVRNNKFNDENLSSASREISWLDNQINKIGQLDKAYSSFNNSINGIKNISKNTNDTILKGNLNSLVSNLENEKKDVFKKYSIDNKIIAMRTLANTTNSVGNSLKKLSINETSTANDIAKNALQRASVSRTLVEKLDKKARDLFLLPKRFSDDSSANKFANKYLSDERLSKFALGSHSNAINSIDESSYKKHMHYLNSVERKTKELYKLENNNNALYEKRAETLRGYKDSPLNYLASKSLARLDYAKSQINTDSLTKSTAKSKEFNDMLRDTNLELRQLSRTDAMISRMNGLEGFLSNRKLNSFRKQTADIMKDGSFGTDKYSRSITALNRKITQANTMKAFGFDMKDAIMGSSLGYMTGFMVRRSLGAVYETYKDYDSAKTELVKVADEADVNTTKKLKNISKKAFEIAKDTGNSTADIIRATATSIQSGMGSMESSIAVARKSAILANVGDMSQQDATSAVNTIVKSFNLSPLKKVTKDVGGVKKSTTELSDALDLLNHSGNNYAISSSGVAEALKRGGGVLHAYGVDLKDSVALITAANEPLQNPEKVGTGLKAIAMNFAGISTDAKNGNIKLNKTAKALETIAGIDIYADKKTGQIKSMVNILDELKPKWKSLRDDERAALSEAIAGKHRADVFQALMTNYDQFKKLQSEFENGDHFGSAERENEKFTNSFAGKMNRLKETLTMTGNTLINSKMTYGILDFANALATGLNNVIEVADNANLQLPALMTGIFGLKGLFKGSKSVLNSLDDYLYGTDKKKGNIFERIKNGFKSGFKLVNKDDQTQINKKNTDEVKKTPLSNEVDNINTNSKQIVDSNSQIVLSEKTKDRERENSIKNIKKTTKANNEYTDSIKKVGKETGKEISLMSKFNNKAKEKALNIKGSIANLGKSVLGGVAGLAGGMVGSMTIGLVISKGIELAYGQYDKLANGIARAKKEHIERTETLKAENKNIENNIKFIKENQEAINGLYKKQMDLSKIDKKKLTQEQATDYATLVDLSTKLQEIMPSAIRYDKKGNPILSMSLSAETLTKRLESAQKAKQKLIDAEDNKIYNDNIKEFFYGEKIGSNFGGISQKLKGYKKDLEKIISTSDVEIKYDINKGLAEQSGKSTSKIDSKFKKAYSDFLKPFDFLGNRKDYKKAVDKYKEDMNNIYSEADKVFAKHNEQIAKYDEASAHNSQIAQRKLSENSRFKKLSEQSQNAVSDFGSLLTWGKIKNQGEGLMFLNEIGEKLQPQKIQAFSNELRKLNDAYLVDKDYGTYSKGINKLVDDISTATGISKTKISGMIKDVDRYYQSLDEKQEVEYLKKHGAKYSDLESDNKAIASRTDFLLDRYRRTKQLNNDLLEASDDVGAIKSVLSSASEDKALGGIGAVAKMMANSKGDLKAYAKDMLALTTLQTAFNDGGKENNKVLADFNTALKNNTGRALDLGNGLKFSAEFMKLLKDNKITDFNQITPTPQQAQNTEARERVANHYKGWKNVSDDTINKISNANLSNNEMKRLDELSSNVHRNLRDAFRGDASKFFVGVNNVSDGLKNMAESSEGLKLAITSGLTDSIGQFNKQAYTLGENASLIKGKLKETVDSLSPEKWIDYVSKFGDFNKSIRAIANEKVITDVDQLTNMQNVYNSVMNTGKFNRSSADKIVRVGVETFGTENIGQFNTLLNSLPEEKKIKLMTVLQGESGSEYARGLSVLKNHFGGNTQGYQIAVEAIVNGDIDLLKKLTSENVEQKLVEFDAKLKGGKNSVKKQVEESGKGSKVDVNVTKKEKTVKTTEIRTEHQQKQDFNRLLNQNPTVNLPSNLGNSNGIIEKLSSAWAKIKGFVSKSLTLTTNLRGATVGMIDSRARAVNAFPRGAKNFTMTTNLRGATVGMIRSRASAALSFPSGSRTMTLTTIYQQVGSPSSGGASRMPSGLGGARGRGSNLGSSTSLSKAFNNTDLFSTFFNQKATMESLKNMAGIIPKAFNTQLNPLVGSTIGGASITSGQTSIGGTYIAHGGVASPTATTNPLLDATTNFKIRPLKGFEYKGVTQIGKLTYSVKEMSNAFEKDIDILKEFEQALTRINDTIKILETHMQRARGATRIAWLNKVADTVRENNRRLLAERNQVEKLKLFYMDKAKKDGYKFLGAITTNRYEMELKYANKLEDLNKKKEKAKGKNLEKIEKEIKEIEKSKKALDKAIEYSEKEFSIDTSRSENYNKIGDIEDEKNKLVIEAWKENFEAVSKLMDNEIQKINTSLDILGIKFKFAFGKDRLDILDEQIEKYEQMESQLERNITTLNNLKSNLQSKLIREGFKFSGDEITNYQNHLAHLKDTSTLYEEIKGLANDYFDIVNSRIPNALKEMEEFNSKLLEANKQKLEDTKSVEDKIMQMIKKQSDERIKLLDKETRKRIDLIKKKKDEYNEARKEVEYLDEYRKKKEEIDKLKRKRDKLLNDDSQKGQAELQKVEKSLEQKLDELQKLVGKNIDTKVNDIYDNYSKTLDEYVKNEREKAEDELTESKLLKKAQEAISSGLFENVNGEIQSLQSALVDYINEFEGGLSATGSLIQSELIAKLNVAQDTVKNFSTTLSSLELLHTNMEGYIQTSKYDEIDKKNNAQISHYAPLIYINGNVDPQSRDMIEKEVQKYLAEHDKFIKSNIR